jgi:hypothetical protein
VCEGPEGEVETMKRNLRLITQWVKRPPEYTYWSHIIDTVNVAEGR